MKIAFIYYGFYIPNEVLTPLYEYSQILSQKGIDITVFVRSHKSSIKGRGKLHIKPVCKEYFNSKITHIIFIIKLIFLLRKERFDIIHVFNTPGACLLPLFCKKKQKNTQWILDIQTGAIFGGLKSLIYDRLTVFEAKFFDKVSILSKHLKDKLFGNKLLKDIYVVPLGANIKRFEKIERDKNFWQKLGITDNTTILIYIGKLDKTRMPENMLKAFQTILQRKRNEKIKLVIVGGDDNDIERLQKESTRLLIDDKVLFLGRTSYESIPFYLVNADMGLAYIPKNIIYDAQPPLKTYEYLAASLPVVATNTLGNLEILKNGINGVVTSDDHQDFAHGILTLLNNQQLYSDIRNCALNSIENYGWEKITEMLLAKVYIN
ncbi:MAG: glycosyltransferase family 4 protein [Candidatus Kuenenia sp.]|nr:glycosyltransferase family 4 protein [Candidatus Kuenenia hertensis]